MSFGRQKSREPDGSFVHVPLILMIAEANAAGVAIGSRFTGRVRLLGNWHWARLRGGAVRGQASDENGRDTEGC